MVTHAESFWVGEEARSSPSEAVLTEVPTDQLFRKKTSGNIHFIWGYVVGGEGSPYKVGRITLLFGFLRFLGFFRVHRVFRSILKFFEFSLGFFRRFGLFCAFFVFIGFLVLVLDVENLGDSN
jgi:hypothetical protein